MSTAAVLFAVVFAGFAVSYGWGMRGFVIGGEKGALLPGALLGLSVALFAANGAYADYWLFFAGAGALSMFYGGTEPYAQTMRCILFSEQKEYKGLFLKGSVGIFLKGALWHGIAGGVLGILPSALRGDTYKFYDFIILFALLPLTQLLGTRIFNSPYNKEKNIFPKIYFSFGSREEWGGNLLFFVLIIVYSLIRGDYFAAGAALFGAIGGGAGFLGGLYVYFGTFREHKGKYFFGKAQKNGFIDNWKIMEHFFGALGGSVIMLYFCLAKGFSADRAALISLDTLPLYGKYDTLCAVIAVIMLFITLTQYALIYLHKTGKLKKCPSTHIFELLERPFWASFPLMFIFLGSEKTAGVAAFFTIVFALCDKCIFEWFENFRHRAAINAVFIALLACSLIYFFAAPAPSIPVAVLLYTFGYTLPTLFYIFAPAEIRKYKASGKSFPGYFKSAVTVGGNFVFQSAAITVAALIICR